MSWYRRLPSMATVVERAAKASRAHIVESETSLTCRGCGGSTHFEGPVESCHVHFGAGFLPARDAFALSHAGCSALSHDTHASVA